MPADDWRGAGDLGSREIGTELNLITAVSFTKTVIFQQDLLPLQATAVSRTKSPNSIKAI